jgi:hypothetical protein
VAGIATVLPAVHLCYEQFKVSSVGKFPPEDEDHGSKRMRWISTDFKEILFASSMRSGNSF